jgi:hypothetical protein
VVFRRGGVVAIVQIPGEIYQTTYCIRVDGLGFTLPREQAK